jgi:ATP-binding cassette subfamily B protein
VAQQPERRWHLLEDQQLDAHWAASASMDRAQTRLSALPARGWLLLGCAGLIPSLLSSRSHWAEVAIAVGGILQAYGALGALTGGALTLASARVAWARVGPLFHAASRFGRGGNSALALAPRRSSEGGLSRAEVPTPVLDARGICFRYQSQHEPTLQNCDLSLFEGDRVLLEGSSGAGKSTLAALLVGLREPDAGHILLSGLDRATLGDLGWRQRVASAPQFHENHILSASLAFNLLMGRAWPASRADLLEAERVCSALGLEPLIARMPSGINQVIGETGWQLSHGERSRLFLARALLQRADVIVLDESFGALDPHTLRRCMHTVLAEARTLVVIAHP